MKLNYYFERYDGTSLHPYKMRPSQLHELEEEIVKKISQFSAEINYSRSQNDGQSIYRRKT